MTIPSFLNSSEAGALFSPATGHLPVRLVPLAQPRVLWLNRRVMRRDPQYARVGNEAAYEKMLLESCAFSIVEDTAGAPMAPTGPMAIADRYGGSGIGQNGGSGRAALVNGYHVKGIGRTPLVSPLADRGHSSGRMCLRECVREAIFSELVNAEFPHGGVPALAIIETGAIQEGVSSTGPKPERQCLLVRPAHIRPAHFNRATLYHTHNPKEGALDALRVSGTLKSAVELLGAKQFASTWHRFWVHWAEQLGYAYVHRLNLSGNTASNIAWDGKLLDFGAMTALPTWAQIATVRGGPPAGRDMQSLVQAFHASLPFVASCQEGSLVSAEQAQATLAQASEQYTRTVIREVLRILGLTRLQSTRLLQSSLAGETVSAVRRLVSYFSREYFTIFDGTPEPRFGWDLDQFWSEQPPAHAMELRRILELAIARSVLSAGDACSVQGLVAWSDQRARTRSHLFRDRMKPNLYPGLDGLPVGDLTPETVGRAIDEWVTLSRRDCMFEPEAAVPMGFARNGRAGYALFRCTRTNQPFAIEEWHAFGRAGENPVRIPISRLREGLVEFADEQNTGIAGSVHLCMKADDPESGGTHRFHSVQCARHA